MAKSRTRNKRQTAPNPDHEQQPADETIAKGEHMDLGLMEDALDAERSAGAPAPTGVILGSPSASGNPNLSEEMQGMELIPKTVGPPQYGSPDPATSAGRLMTLEDGHPFEGLPDDHPAAIDEGYGVILEQPSAGQAESDRIAAGDGGDDNFNATNGAQEAAEEHGVNLADVQGTGKDGRITKEDVENHVSARDGGDGGDGDEGNTEPQRQDVNPVEESN